MEIGYPEFFNFVPVLLGRVTFVLFPVVNGKPAVEVFHVFVAVGFCQDGCGGDGHVFAVSFDHTGVGDVCIFLEAVAVDDDVLGSEGQLVQCQVHGGNGSVEDVDFVDFVVVDGGYGRADNCLESLSSSLVKSSGRMTAAAKTGPARHPRPASSHPASMHAGLNFKSSIACKLMRGLN